MWCASSWSTSAWWSPRSSRAPRPRATTPAASSSRLRCGTQGVAAVRGQVAGAMNIKPEELRILTDDLGGAFGMKGWCYPEYVADAACRARARKADPLGLDPLGSLRHRQPGPRLVLDARSWRSASAAAFSALRVDCLGNVGAYITGVAHFVFTTHISGCLPTVYDIPHAQVNTRCVFTNTLPTGPYRGAGRPEASYLMERVIDAAADATGIDAAELRRRNLIAPDKIPYTTAFGNTYDSGDFPAVFERALALADYAGFAARKKAAKKTGKLRGIGIGCYLEIAGAFPEEAARITFPGGKARCNVSIGAGGSGQGHPTVFGRWRRAGSASRRGGDADVRRFARATCRASARSPRARRCMSAAPSRVTADKVIEKGKRVAAMLLQAAEADVDYRDGKFSVNGSGREVSLFEVAERAAELARRA